MKPFYVAITILILTAAPVSGRMFDDWTGDDFKRQAAVTTLLAVDWAQTRYVAKHPDRHYETNPVIGRHPSTGRVDLYFAASVVGSWLAADLMPRKWRKRFQVFVVGMESVCVGANISAGVKLDF